MRASLSSRNLNDGPDELKKDHRMEINRTFLLSRITLTFYAGFLLSLAAWAPDGERRSCDWQASRSTAAK
jgi:hypothetical protein